MKSPWMLALIATAFLAPTALAYDCEYNPKLESMTLALPLPELKLDPAIERLLKYTAVEARHRLSGLASYYSNSLDGTLTANGEIYRKKKLTAAHLTLPLGCWVEVKSRATGKTIRLRVNDRGPYSKFVIDLSRSAARVLGVDVAEDRSVLIRIIALPGEPPLPEHILAGPEGGIAEEAVAAR